LRIREKLYESIEDLQQDLDQWLEFYNTERPHLGYRNNGKTPLQTLLQFVEILSD